MKDHQQIINSLKIRCFDLQAERDHYQRMVSEIVDVVKQKIGKDAENPEMTLGQMLSLLSYNPPEDTKETKPAKKKGN